MFEQFLVYIVHAGTILEEKSCRKSEKDKSIYLPYMGIEIKFVIFKTLQK